MFITTYVIHLSRQFSNCCWSLYAVEQMSGCIAVKYVDKTWLLKLKRKFRGKDSAVLNTSWSSCLYSWLLCDVSHKTNCRLPVLCARLAVTFL